MHFAHVSLGAIHVRTCLYNRREIFLLQVKHFFENETVFCTATGVRSPSGGIIRFFRASNVDGFLKKRRLSLRQRCPKYDKINNDDLTVYTKVTRFMRAQFSAQLSRLTFPRGVFADSWWEVGKVGLKRQTGRYCLPLGTHQMHSPNPIKVGRWNRWKSVRADC